MHTQDGSEEAIELLVNATLVNLAIATPAIGRLKLDRRRVDAAAHRVAEGYP